jgi:hypothetical protein
MAIQKVQFTVIQSICAVHLQHKYFYALMRLLHKYCLLLIILLYAHPNALAQGKTKANEEKKLIQLMEALKKADGYSYRIGIQSAIAGDTQKTPLQIKLNYADQSRFIIYSKSENELFFLCSEGQFKVDNIHKTAYFKAFESDSALAETKNLYLKQMAVVMDSLFLTNATIADKKVTKKNIFYRLSYPPYSAIQSFNILARLADNMPEKIQYTIDQNSNPDPNSIKIRQYLTMDQYKKEMPKDLFEILANTRQLYQYLNTKYPSYTIQKL